MQIASLIACSQSAMCFRRMQLLWRGSEAMQAALRLLKASEGHAERGEDISWAQPFMRPAKTPKEARGFGRLAQQAGSDPSDTAGAGASSQEADRVQSHREASSSAAQREFHRTTIRPVSVGEAAAAVPGLHRGALTQAAGPGGQRSAALWIEGSHVVHPRRYLRALWRACEGLAAEQGAQVVLHQRRVESLEALEASHGPYSAIVAAAGAAGGVLPELGVRAIRPHHCSADAAQNLDGHPCTQQQGVSLMQLQESCPWTCAKDMSSTWPPHMARRGLHPRQGLPVMQLCSWSRAMLAPASWAPPISLRRRGRCSSDTLPWNAWPASSHTGVQAGHSSTCSCGGRACCHFLTHSHSHAVLALASKEKLIVWSPSQVRETVTCVGYAGSTLTAPATS